jgi:threonylcarbamoyladenosine tRNA methylthiotransferase MtaB
MRIYMKALGCRLNEAELEDWAYEFVARGHVLERTTAEADLILVNTCAVTRAAVKKSRQEIRRARRDNPLAKLVISGCYASLDPGACRELKGIDLLVSNQDKDRLVQIVDDRLMAGVMPVGAMDESPGPLYQRGRTRAFVKIQDGCRHRCTFCIVTQARGTERSRKPEQIVAKINSLHAIGVKEVVLTGVHVGGYGSDIDSDLSSLIHAILAHTDIPRLRLASVEPWDLPDSFFMLFENSRLMPHLHLPLQSGSDAILKTMARRCKTAPYGALTGKLRSAVPDFNFTTDIIVGFPGETDREWQKSMEFIEFIGFSHIHIFPYSARPGTAAAAMPDHVPYAVKMERCRQLAELAARMKLQCLQQQVGRATQVLVENRLPADDGTIRQYQGYTPAYHRVRIANTGVMDLHNKIKDVTVVSLNEHKDGLLAKI